MPSNIKKILVVQTAFIGDVFLMIPLLKAIRDLHLNCEISIVVREGLGEFLKNLGTVDYFVEISKSNKNSYQEAQQKLNSKFDYIFCPHESLRSALFVSKLNSKNKIGFKSWWNFLFFDIRIKKNYLLSESLRQLQLIQNQTSIFNVYFSQTNTREMDFQVPDHLLLSNFNDILNKYKSTQSRLMEQLGLISNKKYIVIFPGSVWPTKQWTLEGFNQIAQKFIDNNFDVVLMGSKNEFTLCENIESATQHKSINIAGKYKLWDSFLILSKSQIAITNDSGSMHMAAIANIPTVAIFGPTTLKLGFRPWQNKAKVVENNNLNCRPCGKHGHNQCPLKHHHCMTEISAEQVWDSIQNLI